MGWADGFASGVHLGRSLVDTYQSAKQRRQLDEVAEATPEDVMADDQSNAGPMPDGTALSDTQAAGPAVRVGTRFLGKTYDQPLNDNQVNDARVAASAGVLMRTDPVRAQQMLQSAQQGTRDAQRFDREQTGWQRQDADYQKAQDYEKGRGEAFAGTYYGRQTAEYAQSLQKWKADKAAFDAAVAAGQAPPGPAPTQPQRPAYGIGQSLADEAMLLAHDAKFGKLDPQQFVKFTERARAIEQEGYGKALRLAQGGATIDAVAQAFNSAGAERFDPKSVVSDKQVKNAQGVTTREIVYRTPDGQTQTINTLAELDALGQAQDMFTRHFQGRQDQRADKELGMRGASLALDKRRTDASVAHTQAQTAELTQKTEDRKELSTIRDELTTAIDAGDAGAEKRARDKLMGYTLTGKGGQNMSDLERRANFLLASGAAKTMTEAAKLAHEKVQSSPKDDFIKLTTGAMPLSGEQLEGAMQIMHGTDWKTKVGGGSGAAGGGVPAPAQREVGKTYQTPQGPMIWRGTGWEAAK